MNILNALYTMGVSIVNENGQPKMRGAKAKEAAKRFAEQRANILDEVALYPVIEGIDQRTIDQARAIASAWDWSEGDWELYWDRTEDILGRKIDFTKSVNDIYTAEQVTHPGRYA